MKEDLAGGKLPSGDFSENAAWWLIMVLAHNLNTAMKNLILKGSWVTKRMKAIRFHLINLPEELWKDHDSFSYGLPQIIPRLR